MPSVEQLRKSLTKFQRELLDRICTAFVENGEGQNQSDLYIAYIKIGGTKELVSQALEQMGGSVVREAEDQKGYRYWPTLLGLLLSSRGRRYELLLESFIEYIANLALEGSPKREFSHDEIQAATKFSDEEMFELFRLASTMYIFGSSWMGEGRQTKWNAVRPREIADIVSFKSKIEYVHQFALKDYDSKRPVSASGNRSYPGNGPVAIRPGQRTSADDEDDPIDMLQYSKPDTVVHDLGKKIIFVSHTSTEAAFAICLKECIEKTFPHHVQGFVTSDPRDLRAGKLWLKEIETNLGNAAGIIVVCSPSSITRPWIHFEAGCAWIRGVPIIPICHAGFTRGQLEQPIATFQGLNLEDKDFAKQLLESIAELLGLEDVPEVHFSRMEKRLRAASAKAETKSLPKVPLPGTPTATPVPKFGSASESVVDQFNEGLQKHVERITKNSRPSV